MIKEIFFKEVRDHIGSSKMIIAFTIIMILFLVNSLVFVKGFSEDTIEYQKINNETQNRIKNGAGNLWQLTFTRQKLVYPPSLMGFMAEGFEKQLPNGMQMDFFSISNPEYYRKKDLFLSGAMTPDWNSILIFFVSFICIFFSYNAFSGEKFNGTLKLIISNPVSRSHVIMGKYFGICFITFIPVLAGVLITITVFVLSPVIQFSSYYISGITYYMFAAILFISLNVFIGMLVSALTSNPVFSLSLVILIWLVFSIVLPGVGWIVSKKAVPVASLSRINDKLLSESKALGGSYWDDRWKTPTPEVLENKAYFDQQDKIINQIWNEHRNSLHAQVSLRIAISMTSPFQVFRFLSERISDNGYYRGENFYDQIKDYHLIYKEFIVNKDNLDKDSYHLIWHMPRGAMKFMSDKSVSYEEIPKFEYKSPSLFQKIVDSKWELFILMVWNVFLITGVFLAFARYDVR